MIGDTWDPIESIGTMKCFLEDSANHKGILQKLDLVVAFLQANVKHIVFVKLKSRYG